MPPQPETDQLRAELQALLAEYPLYLRWGQLVELHRRLGLGAEKLVRRAIQQGRIERVSITGKRDHYTRSSVERMVSGNT